MSLKKSSTRHEKQAENSGDTVRARRVTFSFTRLRVGKSWSVQDGNQTGHPTCRINQQCAFLWIRSGFTQFCATPSRNTADRADKRRYNGA